MAEVEGAKLNAYVFMHLLEPGKGIQAVKEEFSRRPGFRFVAQFVGSFVVFGAVELDGGDLEGLQKLIAGEYWEAGVRSEWSTLVKGSVYGIPKRGSPDYCAMIRARADGDPVVALDALDAHFGPRVTSQDPDFHYGAGVVSGRGFDLLIDLGATSLGELHRLVLEDVRRVPGVGTTDSSFAFLPGNEIRRP